MGLKKTFKNRAGVEFNFTTLNRVEFLNNNNGTYTVVVQVNIYLNRKAFRDGNEPVERERYEFTVDKDERLGKIERKVNELLLTTSEYSGAVEEND